jgi:hypothetical protein
MRFWLSIRGENVLCLVKESGVYNAQRVVLAKSSCCEAGKVGYDSVIAGEGGWSASVSQNSSYNPGRCWDIVP